MICNKCGWQTEACNCVDNKVVSSTTKEAVLRARGLWTKEMEEEG